MTGTTPAAAELPTGAVLRPAGGRRLAWVDVVKGLAIVLVVHYHAVLHLDAFAVVPGWLNWLDYVLAQMRMPLLFLASGLFAARTTSGPWRRLLHKRVAHLLWLYALWCLIDLVDLRVVPQAFHQPAVTTWPTLLEWTLVPSGVLWFIYGLALFSVLAKLLAPLPPAVPLAASAVLAVAVSSGWLPVPGDAWHLMATSFVFFLLGVRCSGRVQSLAARATPVRAAALGAAALLVQLVAGRFELRLVPGVDLLGSVLLVATAVAACVVLAPSSLGRAAAWLGERTLPVYLLHMQLIGLAVLPLVLGGVRPLDGAPPLAGAVGTVLLTGFAVLASLLLHRVLVAAGATWLFALPRRWAWRGPASPPAGAAGGARHRGGAHRSRARGLPHRAAHRAGAPGEPPVGTGRITDPRAPGSTGG